MKSSEKVKRMEYISSEEFLKQPKEIQKVFLDWWKPQENDLFQCSKFGRDIVLSYDESRRDNEILSNCGGCCYGKNEVIPLFTEGQIRQFVEDAGYFITLNSTSNTYNLFDLKAGTHKKSFEYREKTILETYWKVALEIEKEKVKA